MTMNKRSIWSPMQRPSAGYDAQGHGPVYGAFQGGMPQIHPDKGQDYVDAKLRPGEYVLRPEAVQAMGGPQQVDKMNAMGGPNRPQQFGPMTPPPPLGSGGMAPPPMHNFEQNMMDFVPSPVSEVTKRDRHGNQTTIKYDTKASQGNPQEFYGGGPVYAQGGGWLDNVLNWQGLSGDGPTVGQKIGVQPGYWYGTDEEEERKAALQARPGIRPGDDINPILSDAVNDAAYAKISTAATGEFSDESLMANSSSNKVDTVIKAAAGAQTQLEGTPWAGYEGYGQQDYVEESQPRDIEGGSADPLAQGLDPSAGPTGFNVDPMTYDAVPQMATDLGAQIVPNVPNVPGMKLSLNTADSTVNNPVVSFDPYTGEATLADGQVLTDPTPEQLEASGAREDSELAVDRVIPTVEATPPGQGSRVAPGDVPLDPAFQEALKVEAKRKEDFRIAEDKIAGMTGMNTQSISDEQVKDVEQKVNTALQSDDYKELADSLTEAGVQGLDGKGVNQQKVKDLIDNVDGNPSRGPATKDAPSGFDKVQGMLSNIFQDLFGTDNYQQALMRGLIMYGGARLTGMSSNQALAFAAKDGLASGDRVRAKAEQEKKEIDARRVGVQELKAETIDWSKAQSPEYKHALETYYKTGELEGLPLLPEETAAAAPGIARGAEDQSDSLYVAGVQVVPYVNAANSKDKARYVDYDLDGDGQVETYTVPQFKTALKNKGIETLNWNDSQHSYDATRDNFGKFVTDEVEVLNSPRGKEGYKTAVNAHDLSTTMADVYTDIRKQNPRISDDILKKQVREAGKKYLKDLDDYNTGKSNYRPSELDTYIEDRIFKKTYGPSGFETAVGNSDSKITSGFFNQVLVNVEDESGNPLSPNSKGFDEAVKKEIKETMNAFLWMKKNGQADAWIEAAKAEDINVTPYMLWASSLMDPYGSELTQDAVNSWNKYQETKKKK